MNPQTSLGPRRSAFAAAASIILPLVLASLLEDVIAPFFDTIWLTRIGSPVTLVVTSSFLALGGFLYRRLVVAAFLHAKKGLAVVGALGLVVAVGAAGLNGLALFVMAGAAILACWGLGYGLAAAVARIS